MSGKAGQGGIELLSTYLLISGCLHSPHAGQMGRGLGFEQPHGDSPHLLHPSRNPSFVLSFDKYNPIARPTTKIPNI
jgi:hypothetical protein